MFTLKNRATTITCNEDERNTFNQSLIEIQEKEGVIFSSVKDAFSRLLSFAIKPESTENEKPIEVEKAENILEFTESTEKLTHLKSMLDEFRSNQGLSEEISVEEIILKALILAQKAPEIKEVEKEVIKEVPISIGENQLLLTITDQPNKPIEKKKILLDEIHIRRKNKKGISETKEQMLEKMIFNDNIIFNLGGEFFTGF